jgi:arabinan endo-1,5-alpha-L-arabinosidase
LRFGSKLRLALRPHPVRLATVLVIVVVVLTGTVARAGAATQQPVDTNSTPDPGVTLYDGNFFAFTTGGFGLWESTAPIAAGPWTAPANVMDTSSAIPAWIDQSAGIWAPDMIQIPTSNEFVVYFAALLNASAGSGTTETPQSGARCIGAAESSSPTGPFTIQPNPVVCLEGYGAADDMTADPGNRVIGEGAIDPDPVIINNSWDDDSNELFLTYKTQSGTGQATIRMVRLDMTTNGTTILGDSHQLLSALPTGSGGTYQFSDTIEAPSLLSLPDGWFVLFVAQGNYASCGYSTEAFTSQHPWSWTQTGGTTVLSQSLDGLCGPGGASVSASEVSGQYRLFFHAYADGTAGSTREMYADVLTIGADGHTPQLTPLAPAS